MFLVSSKASVYFICLLVNMFSSPSPHKCKHHDVSNAVRKVVQIRKVEA